MRDVHYIANVIEFPRVCIYGHCRIIHSNLVMIYRLVIFSYLPLTTKHILLECTHLRNIPVKRFSRSLLNGSCLKALTIILLLLLSKKHIFIINVYCNVCYCIFILVL